MPQVHQEEVRGSDICVEFLGNLLASARKQFMPLVSGLKPANELRIVQLLDLVFTSFDDPPLSYPPFPLVFSSSPVPLHYLSALP